MSKRYRELAKNTWLIAIGNFSSKILMLLLIPLYTSFLTTSEYGVYDLVYTTVQLLFPVLTVGITESIMVFLLKGKTSSKDVFSTNIKFIFIANIVFGLLVALNVVFGIFGEITDYSFLIIVFYLLYCLNSCFVQFAKGVDEVRKMAIAGVIGTAITLLCNILFLAVFGMGLYGYFLANVLGLLVPTVYLFVSLNLWKYFTLKNNYKAMKQMALFSIPLVVNMLAWWVNNMADRYIITGLYGTGENGLLSVAYKIPSILTAVSAIFIQAWQISAIKESKDSNQTNAFYSKTFFAFSGVLCVLTGILIVLSKVFAGVLFNNDFFGAWVLVPFLLMSSLFNQLSGYIGAILAADEKTKAIARSAIVGITANIVLDIALAKLLGPIGITIATMIASVIIYIMRRMYSGRVISSRKTPSMVISWIILIAMSACMSYLDNPIVTSVLFVIVIVIYKDIYKYCYETIKRKIKYEND